MMRMEGKKRTDLSAKKAKFLRTIARTKHHAQTLHMKGPIVQELETLRLRVEALTPSAKTAKGFLQAETQVLTSIQKAIRKHSIRRERRSTLLFLLCALPTALLYLSMLFALTPPSVYQANLLLYLTIATTLFCLWILWAVFLLFTYKHLFRLYLVPYFTHHPEQAKSMTFSANSVFGLLCMNPLFQLASLSARLVQPEWSRFPSTIFTVFIQAFVSNAFTALANFIALVSVLVALAGYVSHRLKKRDTP